MSVNRFTWIGLAELQDELRRLPLELRDEAGAIVFAHGTFAAREIAANYPEGPTGNLRKLVRSTVLAASRFGARAEVRSAAPHAWIYEHGTGARTTAKGWPRGRMPAAPPDRAAIPTLIRVRARMWAHLAALLERHGLKVRGTIGRAA